MEPYASDDEGVRNPYVMVPCPQELVDEVLNFMLGVVARDAMQRWDADSVIAVFDQLDEHGRSLLSTVARENIGGNEMTVQAACDSTQINPRELFGIVQELGDAARQTARGAVLSVRAAPAGVGDADAEPTSRTLRMPLAVAKIIRELQLAGALRHAHED